MKIKSVFSLATFLVLLAISHLQVGCTSSATPDSAADAATASTTSTPITIPSPVASPVSSTTTNSPFSSGGTGAFTTPINFGAWEEYAEQPLNNPINVYVNANLLPFTDPTGTYYGGVVSIAYVDNGIQYIEPFSGGDTSANSRYNVVMGYDGQTVFHGFFQDNYGAIVLVINQTPGSTNGIGDGTGSSGTTGSVWFKNFGLTYAPAPPTYCWFVSLGPYDCQAWSNGNGGINTWAALYPDNGYTELGTFTGLDVSSAFNGSISF